MEHLQVIQSGGAEPGVHHSRSGVSRVAGVARDVDAASVDMEAAAGALV